MSIFELSTTNTFYLLGKTNFQNISPNFHQLKQRRKINLINTILSDEFSVHMDAANQMYYKGHSSYTEKLFERILSNFILLNLMR